MSLHSTPATPNEALEVSSILWRGLLQEKTAMHDPKKCGRRYDREFKESAVALVRSGRSMTEVSRDLGVSMWSLGRWIRGVNLGQSLTEPKTLAAETPEQRELRRLRQQVAYLERQRDILKKAVGILSAEMPPNSTH
jgi:transposase-like protein